MVKWKWKGNHVKPNNEPGEGRLCRPWGRLSGSGPLSSHWIRQSGGGGDGFEARPKLELLESTWAPGHLDTREHNTPADRSNCPK